MSTNVKWGLITGITFSIAFLFEALFIYSPGSNAGLASLLLAEFTIFIITGLLVYFGIKEQREALSGFITFKECLKSGMAIALIAAIITILFSLIYSEFIDPGFNEKALAFSSKFMERFGASPEQIEQAIEEQRSKINPLKNSLLGLATLLFTGLVKSLISGGILRKNSPPTIPMS